MAIYAYGCSRCGDAVIVKYHVKKNELVILDGTAEECAEAMGMGESCFRSTLSKVSKGIIKKWTIEKRRIRKECDMTIYRRKKNGDLIYCRALL